MYYTLAIYLGPSIDRVFAREKLEEMLKKNNIQLPLEKGMTTHYYIPCLKKDKAKKLAKIINKKADYCAKIV